MLVRRRSLRTLSIATNCARDRPLLCKQRSVSFQEAAVSRGTAKGPVPSLLYVFFLFSLSEQGRLLRNNRRAG